MFKVLWGFGFLWIAICRLQVENQKPGSLPEGCIAIDVKVPDSIGAIAKPGTFVDVVLQFKQDPKSSFVVKKVLVVHSGHAANDVILLAVSPSNALRIRVAEEVGGIVNVIPLRRATK